MTQIDLPVTDQMSPSVRVPDIPLQVWAIAWTQDVQLNHNHSKGGSGCTVDYYTARTASEARDLFEREWSFTTKKPFILTIKTQAEYEKE